MKFFKEAARKVFLSFLVIGLVFAGVSSKNRLVKPELIQNKTLLATTKADLTGGSVYEVVVDRFYDGDSSNNATGEAFRYSENSQDDFRYMHGGDWQGVIDKLDYIKNMGYTAIWISPIGDPQLWGVPDSNGTQWPTAYHGYNVYDPNRANRYFGAQDPTTSKAKLKQLVDAAHAKGMQVILDVVPNHVGDYLQGTGSNAHYITDNGNLKTGTQVQPAAPFNNISWYHNLGDIVNWNDPVECQTHDLGGLDDINQDNTSAKTAMNSSIQSWFTYTGADAARVDAAKCMDPTYIHSIETDSNIESFGECFDMTVDNVANYVGSTKEWGMLDFPLFQSIVNDFAYGQNFNDMSSSTTNSIQNTFSQDYKYNGSANHMVTFIDNHDRNRFLTEAGGNTTKLKNAITFLLTARGVPTILYGTEQNKGNDGGIYINGIADTYNRWDMVKKDAYGNVITDYFNSNTDTYQLITALNGLRQSYEALRNGTQREMWTSANLYAFSRRVDSGTNAGQEVICAFSNKASGDQTVTIPLRSESTLAVGATLVNLLNNSESVVVQAGGVTGKQISVTVSSNSAKIFADPNQGTKVPVTFTVNNATTVWGQNVYISGSTTELGNWVTANAAGPASCAGTYPTWNLTVNLRPGQSIQFKAIKKDANNNAVWEGGSNHTYTVPLSGSGGVTFNWQN